MKNGTKDVLWALLWVVAVSGCTFALTMVFGCSSRSIKVDLPNGQIQQMNHREVQKVIDFE